MTARLPITKSPADLNEASMSSYLKCISPIDGSVYAERPLMEKTAAFAAVKRAEDAQTAWAMRPLDERVAIVRDAVARVGEMND